MEKWLTERYPAIAARAKQEKAIVLWLDQTGLRSDATVAATWAPIGQMIEAERVLLVVRALLEQRCYLGEPFRVGFRDRM
ncbi:hypothetical protein AB0I53_17485 [Saccharopolyspora sp. NPDC050389]|uniref:hypothetical protein n=1 Tax=Saccharopolyspora sp. NPDC050389 TaxID=3155516 RepID=UPI0033DA85D5